MNKIIEVVALLNQIEDDFTVPKNIRSKIKIMIKFLNEEECDLALKIDKSLQELDEISDDPNVPSYTRTQIWSVVSLLESDK